MLISEIFYSVQGEGTLTGVPSVFVRTSGCNLRCRWCDTPYASWKPEGKTLSPAEILSTVRSHSPARHVVLTGGEPMIAPELPELCALLRTEGFHITIETAGTIAPSGIACDLASISPKLANSTPHEGEIDATWIARHEATRYQPEIIASWLTHYETQLKFVVSSESDLTEITALALPADRILLMPEGTTPQALAAKTTFVVEACKRLGYRYCPRVHIDLFGNTRGT